MGEGDADKLLRTVCKCPKNIADLFEYLEWFGSVPAEVPDDGCLSIADVGSTLNFFDGLSVGDKLGLKSWPSLLFNDTLSNFL